MQLDMWEDFQVRSAEVKHVFMFHLAHLWIFHMYIKAIIWDP